MGADDRESGGLNENHLRRLYATCDYLDKLLMSVERALNVSESGALFHRYDRTLPPAARDAIVESIRQLRQSMTDTLARHGIDLPAPSGNPAFAILTGLRFMDDALEELLPQHMKGYGTVSAEAAASLERIVRDLRAGVASMASVLNAARTDQSAAGLGPGLDGRLGHDAPPPAVPLAGGRPVLAGLARLAAVAEALGAADTAVEGRRLADRLGRGRLYVACLGQSKRGKSTLLNALLGRPVLPTGVTPVTSVITVLQHGSQEGAVVRFDDQAHRSIDVSDVKDYVTEGGNPGNRKGVTLVEVALPSDLLASGLCLVDTPGLGSAFVADTETTRAFLPALDGALVVVGCDPPVSGDELDLIAAVARRVGPLLLVMNKADRSSAEEQDEAAAFAERVIADRIGRPAPRILRVSASERLAGRVTRDWALLDLELGDLRTRASALLEAATIHQTRRLADLVQRDIAAQREALARPLRDTEQRLDRLRVAVAGAEAAVRDLGAVLGVERGRLTSQLSLRREQFLARSSGPAHAALEQALASLGQAPRGRRFDRAADAACDVARRHVLDWMREVEPDVRSAYGALMHRFVELGERFVREMASTHAISLGSLATAPVTSADLSVGPGFSFTEVRAVTKPGFWTWLLETVGPRPWALAAAARAARRHLDRLLATNSARVANELDERVRRSQAGLERDLRLRLEEAAVLAERALQRARARHAEGADAVRAAVRELDSFSDEVRDVTGAIPEEDAC